MTYQFSDAVSHNDASNTTLYPSYRHHFQILKKLDRFLKVFPMTLTAEKVDYIFEEQIKLHIIVN